MLHSLGSFTQWFRAHIVLYPGRTRSERLEALEPLSTWLRKVLRGDTDNSVVRLIVPSLSGNCWWETLHQMVKGVSLNFLVGPNLLKLAFSKSQQYKALFFFRLLNKLVNTLMFTFPCAVVAQWRPQCLLRLVSERVL